MPRGLAGDFPGLRPLFESRLSLNMPVQNSSEPDNKPAQPAMAMFAGPGRSQRWIVSIGLLLAVITLVAAATTIYLMREYAVRKEMQALESTSLLLAEDANQKLLVAQLLLDVIAEYASGIAKKTTLADYETQMSQADVHQFLRGRVGANELIDVATFIGHTGDVLNFTRFHPAPRHYLGDRDYFAAHKADPTLQIFYSAPMQNLTNKKWVFYLSRRINRADGEMAGLALVGISIERFSDLYRRICETLGEGSSVSLYRNDTTLMTRWPAKDELIGMKNGNSATASAISQGLPHSVTYSDSPRLTENGEPQPRLVAVRRLPHYPFVVAPIVPESIYLAEWSYQTRFRLVVTGLFLLLIGFGTWRGVTYARQRESLLVESRELNLRNEKMAARLLASQNEQILASEQLKELNASLEKRITQRTEALRVANERLESYNYTVAHDLRAPLRLIVSYSQILGSRFGKQIPVEAMDFVERIAGAGKIMVAQIEGLLGIANAGQAPLKRTRVDLSAMADDICEEFLQTTALNHKVAVKIEPGLEANADPTLIRLVLQNLVSNACKYSAKTATPVIEFGCREENGQRCYYVRDNGAGFNMAYINKLFRPFQRLHAVSQYDGIGIGLATVRAIIERHNGRVWAESVPDVSTTFYFTLG